MSVRRLRSATCVAVAVMVVSVRFVSAQVTEPQPSATTVRDEALRRKLLGMTEVDQKARVELMQEMASAGVPIGSGANASDPKYAAVMKQVAEKLAAVDGKNRARLQEIVKEHGWPGISLVGKDGAHAAWLLVQHADADREFQKTCLARMEAMPDGEVEKQSIAYLTDRVLVGEKKQQRYGTQMGNDFKPAPIEDPDNVDKRREEVGLPPLAEYIRASKEAYQNLSADSSQSKEGPRQ